MNNEAPQKLQSGGAEREARELRKLILAVAREAVELAIVRSDLTWDDAADITAKQIAIDAALAIFGQATCDDQPTESAKKLMAFAARCANEARLEALEQALPAHKCGLYLTHNEHRDYYERLEQYLESRGDFFDDVFESPEARQRALDTDEMWHLQWYPDTPVGFFHVAAPTLKEVLARAAGCK